MDRLNNHHQVIFSKRIQPKVRTDLITHNVSNILKLQNKINKAFFYVKTPHFLDI